jgi:hypothetical protein
MQLKLVMPSEIDCARMAMAIDTEGTIDIHNYRDPTHPGREYLCDRMGVLVANTDPRLPMWCKENFGGSVIVCKYKAKAHHRILFKWTIYANKAMFVLQTCLPFMLLKKDQAELAILWQSTKTRKYAKSGIPAAIRVERERLHSEITRLKHVPLDHLYRPN